MRYMQQSELKRITTYGPRDGSTGVCLGLVTARAGTSSGHQEIDWCVLLAASGISAYLDVSFGVTSNGVIRLLRVRASAYSSRLAAARGVINVRGGLAALVVLPDLGATIMYVVLALAFIVRLCSAEASYCSRFVASGASLATALASCYVVSVQQTPSN
eukprot:6192728-Pleurochrysis_carterae.AAC.1